MIAFVALGTVTAPCARGAFANSPFDNGDWRGRRLVVDWRALRNYRLAEQSAVASLQRSSRRAAVPSIRAEGAR